MEKLLKRPWAASQEEQKAIGDIQALIRFERFCRDNAQWDAMRTCFSDDSRVNISWYQGSGDGFVTASAAMTTYAPHELHSMLTWVNDDRAVSIVTATIRMRRPFDGVLCELSSDVQLLYRTRRVNGQWYICGFDSIYEQDRLIPVLPDTKLNLESEALQNYRQSYACMSCFAEKSGIPTNQELAGRDRPETVQALYSELDRWLCREE